MRRLKIKELNEFICYRNIIFLLNQKNVVNKYYNIIIKEICHLCYNQASSTTTLFMCFLMIVDSWLITRARGVCVKSSFLKFSRPEKVFLCKSTSSGFISISMFPACSIFETSPVVETLICFQLETNFLNSASCRTCRSLRSPGDWSLNWVGLTCRGL